MGRVINPDSIGKERNRLTREIVVALRELMRQTETNQETKDLAAFIVLALEYIYASIDSSVEAWEKRGYWLKADRFRMEWTWTQKSSGAMRQALLAGDWPGVAMAAVQVAEKLKNVEIPQRRKPGSPWEGAWEKLKESSNGSGPRNEN